LGDELAREDLPRRPNRADGVIGWEERKLSEIMACQFHR